MTRYGLAVRPGAEMLEHSDVEHVAEYLERKGLASPRGYQPRTWRLTSAGKAEVKRLLKEAM